MKKQKVFNRGIVLSVLVLFIGAGIIPSISGYSGRDVPDPTLSFAELTATSTAGLTTCPAGDGATYQYLKITVKNAADEPIQGLVPDVFEFILTAATPDTQYYGELSCTFTAVDPYTNPSGEIRFTIRGDTSIYGNISIKVVVIGIQFTDSDILPVNTVDITNDGAVTLGDFSFFGQKYTHTSYRCDYTWDPDHMVTLGDFSFFGQHYTHQHS